MIAIFAQKSSHSGAKYVWSWSCLRQPMACEMIIFLENSLELTHEANGRHLVHVKSLSNNLNSAQTTERRQLSMQNSNKVLCHRALRDSHATARHREQ